MNKTISIIITILLSILHPFFTLEWYSGRQGALLPASYLQPNGFYCAFRATKLGYGRTLGVLEQGGDIERESKAVQWNPCHQSLILVFTFTD